MSELVSLPAVQMYLALPATYIQYRVRIKRLQRNPPIIPQFESSILRCS